jgi:hypothetical protein
MKIIFAEDSHYLDVVAGVPVAMGTEVAVHAWLVMLKRRERRAPATRIVR